MKNAGLFLVGLLLTGSLGITGNSIAAEQRAQNKRESASEVREVERTDKGSRVKKEDARVGAWTEESWEARVRRLRHEKREAQ